MAGDVGLRINPDPFQERCKKSHGFMPPRRKCAFSRSSAQRPKGLVNSHVGDPVVIQFIEFATRKRRGIPAMCQTAGSGL
jgi:hypothetical protein